MIAGFHLLLVVATTSATPPPRLHEKFRSSREHRFSPRVQFHTPPGPVVPHSKNSPILGKCDGNKLDFRHCISGYDFLKPVIQIPLRQWKLIFEGGNMSIWSRKTEHLINGIWEFDQKNLNFRSRNSEHLFKEIWAFLQGVLGICLRKAEHLFKEFWPFDRWILRIWSRKSEHLIKDIWAFVQRKLGMWSRKSEHYLIKKL